MSAADASSVRRNREERAGVVRGKRSQSSAGASTEKTNTVSKFAHVHTSTRLKHTNDGSADKASPSVFGAAATGSILAPASGTHDEYLSSDNSDEDMADESWQDDDPIRSKVGSLLAKYGRMEGVKATSYSKEAVKSTPPDRQYEQHNNMKTRALPDDMHVKFKQQGGTGAQLDDDEYVIIEGMDVYDTSTETSVEPQSGSEGVHSINDVNDDSFEDLEWDGDTVRGVEAERMDMEVEDQVDNAVLMTELRAAVAASLASVDAGDEGRKSPPFRSILWEENRQQATASSVTTRPKYENSQSNDVFNADADDDKRIDNEFDPYSAENAFSRIGRYPRMFPLQDDECSDSLSIITELTEPDNDTGRLSSRSITPTTDSRRSHSRSSTPIQKPRSSTPSAIEELDTEDEILARPPTDHINSKKDSEYKHVTEATKAAKSCRSAAGGMEVDSSENNSPLPDSVESDHSFSQTSECSATESAQESHHPLAPLDGLSSKRLLLIERRDSFDALAESSLQESASVDFTEVYEANKKYVDATECDFDKNDIRLNSVSLLKSKQPEKPPRMRSSPKEKAKSKISDESKKKITEEASEIVKRTSKQNTEEVTKTPKEARPKMDYLRVGNVEIRKKISGKESSRNKKTKEKKIEIDSDDLADSYKEIRKSLAHVERNVDYGGSNGKRRKMSDGEVVDRTPMASLSKLTEMFDVAPAYMRAGSPRPSDSDRKESTSSSSTDEEPVETKEDRTKSSNYTVVSVDDHPVMIRKSRKNRETFVMDTEDTGPINVSDLVGSEDFYEEKQIESLHATSCPSHVSFNEGLKPQEDSPTLTSSLKPSKSKEVSHPWVGRTVEIKINDEEIGESSTDEFLDDSAIEHTSQGDNKVYEMVVPGEHSGVEDQIKHHSTMATQSERSHYVSIVDENRSGHSHAEASSVYYSANSETPLQIMRINRRRDHHNESRNHSRLSEPREASILDEEEDEYLDDESDDERNISGEAGGEALGQRTGRSYGEEALAVMGYGSTGHGLHYVSRDCGEGKLEDQYVHEHAELGLETISEGDSELTHDHGASDSISRTSWASSDYSLDNSHGYHAYNRKKVQFREVSKSEIDDGSWSSRSRSRSGSMESVHSNSSQHSEDGYSSNDWDQSVSDNRKSCVSFDSLNVHLDCDSDTAEERAHPEKVEEDFTLSLDLGPRLDPNHNYSSTPLKRGHSEAHGHVREAPHSKQSHGPHVHASIVSRQIKHESSENLTVLKHQKASSVKHLALPKHPSYFTSHILHDDYQAQIKSKDNEGIAGNGEGGQHGGGSSGRSGQVKKNNDSRTMLALPKLPSGSASSMLHDIANSSSTHSNVPPEHTRFHPSDSPVLPPITTTEDEDSDIAASRGKSI